MTADWSPLWVSLRVAGVGVSVALVPGGWLGWALARRRFRGKSVVDAIARLPLALPPLILGTYFLFALAGRPGDFSWLAGAAAAAASAFAALVRAARAAFERLGRQYEQAALSVGVSAWRAFWTGEAPLASRPILVCAALAFSRLAAEFAVTLLVAASTAARAELLAGPLLPAMAAAALAAVYFSLRLETSRA